MKAQNLNINKIATTGTLILIGAGALVFIWYRTRKVLKRGIEGIQQGKTAREADKTIVKSQLSYDELWYWQASDRLIAAMEGAGTSEKTIFDIFSKLKNQSDYAKLVSTFGTRKGRPGIWPSPEINGNLITWLEEDLSGREMRKLSEELAKINVNL